jgi:putative acetyltransferase
MPAPNNNRISVRAEDPSGEAAEQLVRELCVEIGSRYVDQADNGPSPFDMSEVTVPRSAFFIARIDNCPVGCVALRPMDSESAEIKRMYVAAAARRRGIGLLLLAELERIAAGFNYKILRLETGFRQPEAIALYEKSGFKRIPAFGPYIGNPVSICFEKRIG